MSDKPVIKVAAIALRRKNSDDYVVAYRGDEEVAILFKHSDDALAHMKKHGIDGECEPVGLYADTATAILEHLRSIQGLHKAVIVQKGGLGYIEKTLAAMIVHLDLLDE